MASGTRKRRAHKAIMERKERNAALPPYDPAPRWSILIQFFNKPEAIQQLYERLSSIDGAEVIVLDDGSELESHAKWLSLLTRRNDFLLRSNDLYEVRTYDRGISFARGEFIALLQDDDLPPAGDTWLRTAERLFREHPRLAILGGRNGVDLMAATPGADAEPFGTYDNYRVGGFAGLHSYRVWEKPTKSTTDGTRVMFVDTVNRAPMLLRRQAILELGGIDQRYAPFQCDDADLCIRAWKQSWQVAFYDSHFAHFMTAGGMREFNQGVVTAQADANWKRLYESHEKFFLSPEHRRTIEELNRSLSPL